MEATQGTTQAHADEGSGAEVGEGHRGHRCSTQRPGASPQGNADAGIRDVDAVGKGAQAQCTGREGIDTELGVQEGARARAEGCGRVQKQQLLNLRGGGGEGEKPPSRDCSERRIMDEMDTKVATGAALHSPTSNVKFQVASLQADQWLLMGTARCIFKYKKLTWPKALQ